MSSSIKALGPDFGKVIEPNKYDRDFYVFHKMFKLLSDLLNPLCLIVFGT